MITGGESYYGFKDGLNNNKNRDDVTYDKEGGFGLFAWNIFLDTHFSCRGRQGRMMAMISQLHTPEFGIGIDESTAVYVDGNQAEVLGVQGVSFFDFRQAAVVIIPIFKLYLY